MGLAVTGSSYIIEIKMPESNPGEFAKRVHVQMENGGIQYSAMDSHSQRFHIMSGSLMARGIQEPSREHEQTSWLCSHVFLRERSSSSSPIHSEKQVQCPDMSSSMVQDKQDGGTFCTLSKKAKFMTILAFQEL